MRKLFTSILAITALASIAAAGSAANNESHVDLNKLDTSKPWDAAGNSFQSVAFLDNRTLVVSYAIENRDPGLSSRQDPRGGKSLFASAILDFEHADHASIYAWGNAENPGSWEHVYPLSNGNMVVGTPTKLAIYSRDFKMLRERERPKQYSKFSLSADRKFVYLSQALPDAGASRFEKYELAVLSIDDLATLRTFRMSDETVYGDGMDFVWLPFANRTRAVLKLADDDPRQIILSPASVRFRCESPDWVSFGPQGQLIFGCGDLFMMADREGKAMAAKRFEKKRVGLAAASQDAGRWAIGTMKWTAANGWLDRFPEPYDFDVRILDSRDFSEVRRFPVKLWKHTFPRIALSPDGKRLAVLTGSTLTLFQID